MDRKKDRFWTDFYFFSLGEKARMRANVELTTVPISALSSKRGKAAGRV
jgi:hypothetical protein